MKRKHYISKPVVITSLAEGIDENYQLLSDPSVALSIKNPIIRRYRTSDEDVFGALLKRSVGLLRKDAEIVLSRYPSDRISIVLGACDYGSVDADKAHRNYLQDGDFGQYDIFCQNPYKAVSYLSSQLGFSGPSFSVAAACSSGAQALIRAIDLLDAGYADAVLAGGIDFASGIIQDGFESLTVLSSKITNPCSVNRSGVNLGDGAGLFFITNEKIFDYPVAITGFAESSDGYNMTSPEPEGKVVASCIRQAFDMAGLEPEDIDYINLHGTGTHDNDSMECKAIYDVFHDDVPVSSTKPFTGHTLGAAGAIEVGFVAAAIASEQPATLPVHVYDGQKDPDIPSMNFVKCGNKYFVDAALSSSFAFGGCNAVIVLERV